MYMYDHVDDEDRSTYLGMVTVIDDVVGNFTQSLKDPDLQSDLDGLDHFPQLQDPTLMGERMEMLYNICLSL